MKSIQLTGHSTQKSDKSEKLCPVCRIPCTQNIFSNSKGTVLLVILWCLALLAAFSANIGIRIRHKMTFLERIQDREQLRTIAIAGINKARSVIYANLMSADPNDLLLRKMIQFNNPQSFQNESIGQGTFDVSYLNYDLGVNNPEKRFGVIDEQGKININRVDRDVLKELMLNILVSDEDEAEKLATAIYDWREFGDSEIIGFLSDEYYDNLEDPYEEKKADFEVPHELLLVRGIDDKTYDQLKDFITVYGSGAVNFNTASWPVLKALGLGDPLVAKILSTRRGIDDVEATVDDVIFNTPQDVIAKVSQAYGLSPEEKQILEEMSGKGLIGAQSQFIGVQSFASIPRSEEIKAVTCVFNMNNGKITYWREW